MNQQPNFGALTGLVRKCEMRPRFVFATIIGGPGSGKTYGALQLAKGIVGPGSGICLISCEENRAEELYAGLCDFHHVSLSDPAVIEATQRAYGKGRFSWDGEGCDPRIALFAIEQIAPNLGPDGVLIFDGISPVWRGVRDRVDTFTGGDPKKTGTAWQVVGAPYNLLWQRLADAPCHRLICVRGKTETAIDMDGKKRVPYHTPVGQDVRRENEFTADVRVWIDSKHLARFEGRLSALNDKASVMLTPSIGEQIKILHGHDNAEPEPDLTEEEQRQQDLDREFGRLSTWIESAGLTEAIQVYIKAKGDKGGVADMRAWNSPQKWKAEWERFSAIADGLKTPADWSDKAVGFLATAFGLDRDTTELDMLVVALRELVTRTAGVSASPLTRAAAACLIAERCIRKPSTLTKHMKAAPAPAAEDLDTSDGVDTSDDDGVDE